ncbi:LCP family protein [Brevibacillus massiliensis]|uniref:LCP family glycopolymer transferase n=1 Tax=Brevibacillus massiliensis TaxID=1118054 RepID=UPI0003650164|nr:LCP family protein [Brevibacillus massiliensis]
MRTWMKIAICTAALLAAGAAGYVYYLYHAVEKTAAQMYQPLQAAKSELRTQKASVQKQQPISVLLLGVDERENDRGRSDAIILAAVNPAGGQTTLVNIPRDTRTKIADRGTVDKINHAYAFGGVDMAVKTAEQFFQVPIDYYISVNMEGFEQVIDALGGVDVENEMSFSYEDHTFPQGPLHLDGSAALAYARMRYDDPRGDLGRNSRQRQIVKSMLKQVGRPDIVTKAKSVLDQLGRNVKTNVTFSEWKDMLQDYRFAFEQVNSIEMAGEGSIIDGIYYYIVDQDEQTRIQSELQNQLELDKTPPPPPAGAIP